MVKVFVCLLSLILAVAGISMGAPIVLTDTYVQSCSTDGDSTSCGYFGTLKTYNKTSFTSFDDKPDGSLFSEKVIVRELNTNNYIGGYAYTSQYGNSWYVSSSTNKSKRDLSGFYSNVQGVFSDWASTNRTTNNSLYVSNSSWDCFDPKACHDSGEWWRFDTFNSSGSGWWTDTFNGQVMGEGWWSSFSSSSWTDHGTWANVWDSTGGGGTSPTPEPSTYGMLGLGLAGLGLARRKMKS